MNKDHGLEQLLRSMGQDSIERPANLETETLEKMRPYLNHIFPAEIECVDFIMPDVANDPIDGYLYEIFADPERLLNRNKPSNHYH